MTLAASPEGQRDRWLAADGENTFAGREVEHLAQLIVS